MTVSHRCVGCNTYVINFLLWNRFVPPVHLYNQSDTFAARRKDGQHLVVSESDISPASLCWAWDRPLQSKWLFIFLCEGSQLVKGYKKSEIKDIEHSKNIPA